MSSSPSTTVDAPRRRLRLPFWAQVLLGLAVGLVLGFVARSGDVGWLATTLKTVGSTFVQLLQVVVVPLVLTAIIVSIANLRQVTNAARLAVQTLVWFAITALIAVSIGIVIGLVTNPGSSATISTAGAEAPATQRLLARLPHVDRPGQHPRARVLEQRLAVVQRAAARRDRHRPRRGRPLGRRAGRAVPRRHPERARDLPEDHLVGHPARPDRHRRPDRQGGRAVRLGSRRPAGRVHRRRLRRLPDRALRRLPAARPRASA